MSIITFLLNQLIVWVKQLHTIDLVILLTNNFMSAVSPGTCLLSHVYILPMHYAILTGELLLHRLSASQFQVFLQFVWESDYHGNQYVFCKKLVEIVKLTAMLNESFYMHSSGTIIYPLFSCLLPKLGFISSNIKMNIKTMKLRAYFFLWTLNFQYRSCWQRSVHDIEVRMIKVRARINFFTELQLTPHIRRNGVISKHLHGSQLSWNSWNFKVVLKFQRVLKFWSVCENVLNLPLLLHYNTLKHF